MAGIELPKRALVSVYDKQGLGEFGQGLADRSWRIVSTGSTADTLLRAGVPVSTVESVTGFPEILGGRVKTLHPKIHGGLLDDRFNHDHRATLGKHGIQPFGLLVANFYPFADTVASGASYREIKEQIDIGGPAMVSAASKNGDVAILTNPNQYEEFIERAASDRVVDPSYIYDLMASASDLVAQYRSDVSEWLGRPETRAEAIADAQARVSAAQRAL